MGIAAFTVRGKRIRPFPAARKASPVETRDRRSGTAGTHFNGSERPVSFSPSSNGDGICRTALTKEELKNLLFDRIGLSKRECREVVNAIFEEMRAALEAGETVKLEGFGRFQPKERPKRWARNLRSGERIAVSERRVVTFQPSRKLTDSIERPSGPPLKHRVS